MAQREFHSAIRNPDRQGKKKFLVLTKRDLEVLQQIKVNPPEDHLLKMHWAQGVPKPRELGHFLENDSGMLLLRLRQ